MLFTPSIFRPFSIAVVLSVAMSGCVQTQTTMLDQGNRSAISADAVQVYRTPESVACAYEEVAIIHAQGDVNFTNEAQMIRKAKKAAAELGANGVILGGFKEPNAIVNVASAFLNFTPDRRGEMVAIVAENGCRPQAATTTAHTSRDK